MKVINTAYELVQTHGTMVSHRPTSSGPSSSPTDADGSGGHGGRFAKRRMPRRTRGLADLADGEQWATKTDLDWSVAMSDIAEKDLLNPANHPYSISKHFTFDEDATIYRMIRTGASTRDVARTLSKPATFIEKRLNNAQFKQRIQILLRKEKTSRPLKEAVDIGRQTTIPNGPRSHWSDMSYEERQDHVNGGRSSGTSSPRSYHHDGSNSPAREGGGPVGGSTLWGSRNVISKLGKNYAHFERFHRGGSR
ncbi:Hypothetical protein, putative [Bodo saltans]|uniref:Uncharacterized protein n=1 Tax=Bodo saltans TaxID=75058 RepID=A0A0S4JH25_BODSA|nr:Hypothetical protein, putative [Bodo saltans]|eukprot:CUG89391.1 Hypothetical protein, putative [Bodo saltans]